MEGESEFVHTNASPPPPHSLKKTFLSYYLRRLVGRVILYCGDCDVIEDSFMSLMSLRFLTMFLCSYLNAVLVVRRLPVVAVSVAPHQAIPQ